MRVVIFQNTKTLLIYFHNIFLIFGRYYIKLTSPFLPKKDKTNSYVKVQDI